MKFRQAVALIAPIILVLAVAPASAKPRDSMISARDALGVMQIRSSGADLPTIRPCSGNATSTGAGK